jgi:hypothetical protein
MAIELENSWKNKSIVVSLEIGGKAFGNGVAQS